MLEFKLQFYFYKYKDKCVISSTNFKTKFIKENGDFPLLNELVIMIQRYQLKKYGNLIERGDITFKRKGKNKYNDLERSRYYSRFGTKRERMQRKLGIK